jgi:plastocyanin
MRLDRSRLSWRVPLATAILTFGTLGLVACGDDDDGGGAEAQTVSIEVTEGGKTAAFSGAPSSLEPGLVELELTNSGNKPHDMQLLRVEGDHSVPEVIQAANQAFQGRAFPEWFFAGGGITVTAPGETNSVTQVLEPGTYYLADTSGPPPDPGAVTAIEVTGEASDEELPATDTTIETIDYGFETEGDLSTGANEITFENTGAQPHHIVAERIAEGKTIDDVRTFLKNEQGPPPFEEGSEVETAALDGGGGQIVTMNFKEPGDYALLCFISDRQGGPPHSIGEGMLGEVQVK